MRGFLKSSDGLFHLSRKITTVGRENCHLVVTSSPVESEHAVIEYRENEGCYYLQDLNSTQGTYLNGSRINSDSRLAPADKIRFGGSSLVFEFGVDYHTKLTPPGGSKAATTETITQIQSSDKQPNTPSVGFSILNSQHVPAPPPIGCLKPSTGSAQGVFHFGQALNKVEANQSFGQVPAPPGFTFGQWSTADQKRKNSGRGPVMLRTRAQSAGPKDKNSLPPTITGSTNNLYETLGSGNQSSRISSYKNSSQQSYTDLQTQLRLLNDELRRSSAYEAACKVKDVQAAELKDEISTLQRRLRQSELNLDSLSQISVHQTLSQLSKDVNVKKLDAHNLRQKISKMRPDPQGGRSPYHARCADHAPATTLKPLATPSTACSVCRGLDVGGLKLEVEMLRKQLAGSSGQISQMHKDMSNKDTTISHLTKEIENLKKNLEGKVHQISALESSVKRAENNADLQQELKLKDQELASLSNKLKNLEDKEALLTAELKSLKSDLEQKRINEDFSQSTIARLKSEIEAASSKYSDLERNERAGRVSLEQSLMRLEKLKAAVVQSSFSSPGSRAPNKQLSDEEMIVALKKSVEERADLLKQIKDLHHSAPDKRMVENMKNIKQSLSESIDSSPKRK